MLDTQIEINASIMLNMKKCSHDLKYIHDFGEVTWWKAFVLQFSLIINVVNRETYSLLC